MTLARSAAGPPRDADDLGALARPLDVGEPPPRTEEDLASDDGRATPDAVDVALEAADIATARLRRLLKLDSSLLTLAVVLHLAASLFAAWLAWRAGAEDDWMYALMGLLSAVPITNYGRLGTRARLWGRAWAGLFALGLLTVWAALLADRVGPALSSLRPGEREPWLWGAVAGEGAAIFMVLIHLLAVAPRARRAALAQAALAPAAGVASAVASSSAETGP